MTWLLDQRRPSSYVGVPHGWLPWGQVAPPRVDNRIWRASITASEANLTNVHHNPATVLATLAAQHRSNVATVHSSCGESRPRQRPASWCNVQYDTDYRCTSNQPPERATMARPLKSDNYGSPTGKVFGEIGEGACCTPTQAPKRLQVGVVHSAP